ncbi:MAG: hypothetical protein Q7S18_03625 [bacterium]|nr:hypothetical protein [bacterium]
MSIAKKIFIISSVLLASVLFFLGIYNISFKEKTPAPAVAVTPNAKTETSIPEKTGGALGTKNKEKIYSLTNEAIIAPTFLEEEGKIEYYSRSNGSVYKILPSGDEETLIDNNNFTGLENILWSSDKKKVISRFNNGGKIEYSVYDYKTKKVSKLPSGASDVVWNNLGDGILYKYTDLKGKKTLNSANSDGGNWKKIADISSNNTSITPIPQSSFVSFWNSPDALEETSMNLVSSLGGETKKTFSGKYGADYLWSPDGTKSLVSFVDAKGGSNISLATINSNGGELQALNVPTFASKCVWSKDNKIVYYALPGFSSSNYVLPNDYQNKTISSTDTFWKIDITSGKTERIVDTQEIKAAYDATNLFLSPSEDILFFINRTDGKLYGINL